MKHNAGHATIGNSYGLQKLSNMEPAQHETGM